jgi:oxygen-independent coproporphyrinogen-3 oxidase
VEPTSIYVHIPFCEKRCPYCDFHSAAETDPAAHQAFVERLCAEIAAGKTADNEDFKTPLSVSTIYLGGGTPSLLDSALIVKILGAIREKFKVNPNSEVTIECNPNSLSIEKLETYKYAGINRISIGVQSFSGATLRTLGRIHSVRQAVSAVRLAARHFDNVSIDLIHSVPGRRLKLPPRRILKLVQHVSAYGLTSDKFAEVPDERSIHEQHRIERRLFRAGIYKYEVSNYARPGRQCRHNLVYWRCGRWLGFGEGAKSHFNEPWTNNDRIMLGLRLAEGLPESMFEKKKADLCRLVSAGLVKIESGRVVCTARGFLLLNQVILALID